MGDAGKDPEWMAGRLKIWGALWGVPDLATRVVIRFSPRLRRSLGRCAAWKCLISLHDSLQDSDCIDEVLCHEAAHFAVHVLYGLGARSHGSERRALVEKAGHPARTAIPSSECGLKYPATKPRSRSLYIHRCPVCQVQRAARRPVPSWRCRACAEVRLSGQMLILQVPVR